MRMRAWTRGRESKVAKAIEGRHSVKGPPGREERKAGIAQRLGQSHDYREVVEEMKQHDLMRPKDWSSFRESWRDVAVETVGEQDGSNKGQTNQLIEASVEDIHEHMLRALEVEHPGDRIPNCGKDTAYGRELDAEMETATRVAIEDELSEGVGLDVRLERVLEWQRRLQPVNDELFQEYAPDHIRTSHHPRQHAAFLQAYSDALGKGCAIANQLVLGLVIAGDLEDIGLWDVEHRPRSLGLDFDDLPHAQWNDDLIERVRVRGRKLAQTEEGRVMLRAMEAKVIDEQTRNLACQARTKEQMNQEYGREGWRAGERHIIDQPGDVDGTTWCKYAGSRNAEGLIEVTDERLVAEIRRAVRHAGPRAKTVELQKGPVLERLDLISDNYVMIGDQRWKPPTPMRVIDDLSKNLTNMSATSNDRLRCPPTDQPTRVGCKMDRQARERGLEKMGLGFGCEDVEAAFRKIWNSAPGFQAAAYYSIERDEVLIVPHNGGMFGAGANVNGFNAIPELGTSIGRRLLGIPSDHHSDDVMVW